MTALPLIETWVGHVANPEVEFQQMDKNGNWTIDFDEFCDWSISKNLDIDEVEDEDASESSDYYKF